MNETATPAEILTGRRRCAHPLNSLEVTVILNGVSYAGLHLYCLKCKSRVTPDVINHSRLKF